METSQDSAVGANYFWLENDFNFVVWKSKGVESRLQAFAWEPWLCFSWFQLPPGQFQRSILQLVASHPNRTTPKRQSCRRSCHRYARTRLCSIANSQRRNVPSADCQSSDTSPIPPAQVIRPQHLRGIQVETALEATGCVSFAIPRDLKKHISSCVSFSLIHIIIGVSQHPTILILFPILIRHELKTFLLMAGGIQLHESQEDTGHVPHVYSIRTGNCQESPK